MSIRPLVLVLMSMLGICQLSLSQVQWTDIHTALKSDRSEKKIMIDMYTDWCTWCKKMDQNTLNHPDIASYINENFIAVKFDAEYKTPISFKGRSYEFIKAGKRGYHALAAELCKTLDQLKFPTVVFIDENMEVIQPIPSFQDPKSMEVILHYMAGEHYNTTPFRSYKARFKSKLRP